GGEGVGREGKGERGRWGDRFEDPGLADAETERELALCRALLFQARESRVHPECDDKVLADWNGLMIAAMANAGIVFERSAWIETARRGFDFIRRHMTAPDGRLSHSWPG